MSDPITSSISNRAPVRNLPMRVATAPVNWNNDDLPDWRAHVPFPRILDAMQQAGYPATEMGSNFPPNASVLRRELSHRAMDLCGAYQWLPLKDMPLLTQRLDTLVPTFTALHDCGCRHLIVADELTPARIALAGHVPPDGSQSLDTPGFQRLAEGISTTAMVAQRFGLRVHLHNHVGTYVETPDEVAALTAVMDDDAADFCFDTGHYAYGGGDPVQFVEQYAARIGYLHLKDVDRDVLVATRANAWSFLAALRHVIFCPFGDGTVDIPTIVRTLARSSFDGWIVVEQDTCRGDSTTTAANNLAYLVDNCLPGLTSQSLDASTDEKVVR